MAKPASFLYFPDDKVVFSEYTESHAEMLATLGIDEKLVPIEFVRVEITPPDGNLLVPLDDWAYKLDQDVIPPWYVAKGHTPKDKCREALKLWHSHKVIANKDGIRINAGNKFVFNCIGVYAFNRAVVTCKDTKDMRVNDFVSCYATNSDVYGSGNSFTKISGGNGTFGGFSYYMASDGAIVLGWGCSTGIAGGIATVTLRDSATFYNNAGLAKVMNKSKRAVSWESNRTILVPKVGPTKPPVKAAQPMGE